MPRTVGTKSGERGVRDITEQMRSQMAAMTAKVVEVAGWQSTVVALDGTGRIGHKILPAIVAVPRRGDRREQNEQEQDSGNPFHGGRP